MASLFVSGWNMAMASKAPQESHNCLVTVILWVVYERYSALHNSPRRQRIVNGSPRFQRTSGPAPDQDPNDSPTLYVQIHENPLTVNAIAETMLRIAAEHEQLSETLPTNVHGLLNTLAMEGVETDLLAA